MKAFGRKKAQLEKVQPEKLATICAYCHHTLEESLDENEMYDIEVQGLTELIAEYLDES
jgi:Fe-S oxidoreductase